MRKIFFFLCLLFFLFLLPDKALAQQYGQAPGVLGVKKPEVHEPVEAGLGDDLRSIATSLILSSGVFFYIAGKIHTNSFRIEIEKGVKNK